MSFAVTLDQAQINSVTDVLAFTKNGANRAIMRAANYAADRTRTQTYKRLVASITADPDRIKESLTTKRATLANPSSILVLTGKPIPLFRYDVSFMYPTVKGGVTANIYKAGAAPLALRHAFVAKLKSGRVGVFTRTGKQRLPIEEHYGPHSARVFERTPGVEADLMAFGADRFLSEVERQVKLLFNKEFGTDPPEDIF